MDLSIDDLNSMPEAKKLVWQYIMKHNEQGHCRVIFNTLRGDFAAFKNHLTEQCTGDYIFQIDADELPHPGLVEILPELLVANPELDVFLVPRINTVEGLTQEHIEKWGWNINDRSWINYPDLQWRIWRNVNTISWKNKVHEVLQGFKTYTALPSEELFSLYHPKTIERQEKQNNYYETL
jgi:glycosyltransferase involved in cell wall biosynthesis